MIITKDNLTESIDILKSELIDYEIVDRTKVKPFCNTLIEIKKDGVNVMFVSDGEKLIIQNNKPIMTVKVKPKDLSKYLEK